MKKVLALTLAALAALALFAGCSKSKTDPGTIVVGASVTPHAEILEQVRELLKEKGFELEKCVLTHNTSAPLWKTNNGIFARQGVSLNDLVVVLLQ